MKQVSSLREMAAVAAELRSGGKNLALVPLLGALHSGKVALVRAAAQRSDNAVVSLFNNPLQFGGNESAAPYGKDPAADLKAAEESGAAVAFTPSEAELLPRGFATTVSEDALSKTLCGVSRPTHFRGITTVTAKLLNVIRPDALYFGQKTAQRAAVIRKMAMDLHYECEIVVEPTVRERDGLAAATLNVRMTDNQRKEALALSKALFKAKEMAEAGTKSPDRIVAEATHILGQHRRVRAIYISVVDRTTLQAVREVKPARDMLAIAAWVDEFRLIDNIVL